MTEFQRAVERVIATPRRQYTKEEAVAALKECGILDSSGNVADAYKDIVIPVTNDRRV